MADEFRPFNQETDPNYNREPGVAVIPGSNYAREMERFEQFPSKWGSSPGNPYEKREFPKMLYRAELFNGKIACMAAPPQSQDFVDPREMERAEEKARRFTEQCQLTVNDEEEMQRAMESGWRHSAKDACTYLEAREDEKGQVTVHREYEDRNMGEGAKREIAEERDARGGAHIPEMPRRRGRPKGSKNKPAA